MYFRNISNCLLSHLPLIRSRIVCFGNCNDSLEVSKIFLSVHICYLRLGGPYSEKLWPRSWKCCPRRQASGSIFKTEVTIFHYTDRPKPVNNLFIFFSSLSNDFVYSRGKPHASVTVTVVRDRKILTALRTNQIAEFVTVTAWEKKNKRQ